MDYPTYEELGKDPVWAKKLLFAGVFIQENKLHAIFDRYNEMSSKQWLLMAVTASFNNVPDLTTLASAMGCSRQNVKRLAASLEKEGYVSLEKSEKDARSLCVKLSEKGNRFAGDMSEITEDVHRALFYEFTDEEIQEYLKLSLKLMHGIEKLEEFFKGRSERRENDKSCL